jgi:hypothetical protein
VPSLQVDGTGTVGSSRRILPDRGMIAGER